MRIDESRPRVRPGARSAFQRAVASLLLGITLVSPGGLGLLPSQALAAPIADPFVPVGFAPQISATPNGVPMVHITTPNAAGISLNRYQGFDVDAIGLIFNNSLVSGNSTLGGVLLPNPNLSGQSARLIINEVRGSAGSVLAGPVEVFGAPATLIFANPNGISVNGATFLNSPHVTLTTGTVSFLNGAAATSDFALANRLAFDVAGGRISIGANGLSAPGRLDVIAESMRIDGPVSAGSDLNLLAGRQRVEHDTLASSNAVAALGNATVAIDATALGAMTAGQIKLIASEQGVGVRSLGSVAAGSGGFSVSANGDIEIQDVFASGPVRVTTPSHVSVSGTLQSTGDIRIDAAAVRNRGSVSADQSLVLNAGSLDNTTSFLQGNNVTLSVTGLLDNTGAQLIALNDLKVTAGSLINDRAPAQVTSVRTTLVDPALVDAVIVGTRACPGGSFCPAVPVTLGSLAPELTGKNLRLPPLERTVTTEREGRQAQIAAAGNAQIEVSQSLSNRGSSIEAGKALSINAASLDQSARGDVRRTITDQVDSAELARLGRDLVPLQSALGLGSIAVQSTPRVTVTTVPGTRGQVIAGSTLDLTLDRLNNPGAVRSLGDVRIAVAESFVNGGEVLAQRDLSLSAGTLSNTRAQILTGRDGDIRIAGNLTNTAGVIEAGRDLKISSRRFVNQRGALTTRHTNYGDFAPPEAVNCRHEHGFCESTARVESTGPAQLNAARNLTLTTQSFLNEASLLTAGADIDVQAQEAVNRSHLLTTTWHGHWREWRGTLRGYRDHDETGTSVSGQTTALIQAGGQVKLAAAKISNSGNVQGNSVYLGGQTLANGITDASRQTPGSKLPDTTISLANSALLGNGAFSGKLADSLLVAPAANADSSRFLYSGPPAPPSLVSLSPEDLLNALPPSLRPGGQPRFLFDAQAEANALRQAALEQTGRAYFVNGLAYDDQLNASLDTQQRQTLYANAAQFANANHLQLGQALSEAQIAKLDAPILWYVDQEIVDAQGKRIHVLVPTVYLPQIARSQRADIAGGVIRGNDISVHESSEVDNSGFITAARNLILDTPAFINEKRSADIGEIHIAGEDGYIKLTGTKVQPGGFLSAANLQINADRIKSLSGEFQVAGASEQETRDKSSAFLNSVKQRLGSRYTESTNQDHISSEWVQVSKPDPLVQVAIIAAAVVVSIYTAGAASALVASAADAGAGTFFGAAAAGQAAGLGNVVLSSALTSMASTATTGILTGHLEANDVFNAALTGAITGYVGAKVGDWGMSKAADGSAKVSDWSARAGSIAVRAGTQAALNQVRGGDFNSAFTNALISNLAAEGSSQVGEHFEAGKLPHVALHALVGGTASALRHEDIVAGAVGEATAAYLSSKIDDPIGRDWSNNEKAIINVGAAFAGAIAASAAGRDAVTGANAALNEVQNNRLLHPKEQAKLTELSEQFRRELEQQLGRPVSRGEALVWLTEAASSNVDEFQQRHFALNKPPVTSEEWQTYVAAKQFLAERSGALGSFTDERGIRQSFFSATPADFRSAAVYNQYAADSRYRDFYWNTLGINLPPAGNADQLELGTYAAREQERLGRSLQTASLEGLSLVLGRGLFGISDRVQIARANRALVDIEHAAIEDTASSERGYAHPTISQSSSRQQWADADAWRTAHSNIAGSEELKSFAAGYSLGSEFGEAAVAPQSGIAGLLTGPSQGKLNAIRGNSFERDVRAALLAEKGDTLFYSLDSHIGAIPDLPIGVRFGVTDVKDVKALSFTSQLRVQADAAATANLPFNLIISPRTETVSLPLQRVVRGSGGRVFEYDPVAKKFSNVDFVNNRVLR